jgi:hypothetical protein
MNHKGHEGSRRKTNSRLPSWTFVSFVVYELELPSSRLQHVGFVQSGYSQAFHGPSQVFADFK